jgi:hypothetical protein
MFERFANEADLTQLERETVEALRQTDAALTAARAALPIPRPLTAADVLADQVGLAPRRLIGAGIASGASGVGYDLNELMVAAGRRMLTMEDQLARLS